MENVRKQLQGRKAFTWIMGIACLDPGKEFQEPASSPAPCPLAALWLVTLFHKAIEISFLFPEFQPPLSVCGS